MRSNQRFCSRTLKKGACLFINRTTQKIVACGISNIEFQSWIQIGKLYQVGSQELSPFFWWPMGASNEQDHHEHNSTQFHADSLALRSFQLLR